MNISLENKTVLVTGAAGFIGAFLAEELLRRFRGIHVVGIDSMNDYYEVSLKEYRLEKLRKLAEERENAGCRFDFIRGNMADKTLVTKIFADHKPSVVVNLAAQAGVRYSIQNPDVYIESNLIGFYNILEACRHSYDGEETGVEHLVYASSSSVYGNNVKVPYSTDDKVETLSASMPPQRNPTSCWPTPMQSSTTYPAPACVSLRFTALRGVRTWHTTVLQTSFVPGRQ